MAEKGAQFGVLGPLQISVDGVPLSVGTPKQRAVPAVLLINRNRVVATDTLIEAAWEQFRPPDPRASLHSYISNLRKLLANIGVSRTVLASAPPGYRLSVPENDCDIGRFAVSKNAGYRLRRRASSSRPDGTSRRPFPSGAGRCSRTCGTSASSTRSPPR